MRPGEACIAWLRHRDDAHVIIDGEGGTQLPTGEVHPPGTALPLAETIDFRGMMQLPAVMFMDMMMHHSVHHRGQLSMYLRPMGAKVPSIYGESYDAAQARKAAVS